jgi:hypothetical protein
VAARCRWVPLSTLLKRHHDIVAFRPDPIDIRYVEK